MPQLKLRCRLKPAVLCCRTVVGWRLKPAVLCCRTLVGWRLKPAVLCCCTLLGYLQLAEGILDLQAHEQNFSRQEQD